MTNKIFTSNYLELSLKEKKDHLKKYSLGLDFTFVYVDDEEDALEIFSDKANELGFNSFTSSSIEKAIEYIVNNKSKVLFIISDFNMPGIDGFQFRQKVLEVAGEIPFVILSSFVDREMALKGIELKIASFIEKPLKIEMLYELLQKEGEGRAESLRDDYELLKSFTEDASNLIEEIEELCLHLESSPKDTDAISRVFGMVHTIKGSSGFFAPRTLHEFAHAFEDLLKEVQSGSRAVSASLISTWLKACDYLKIFVDELKTGEHKKYDLENLKKMFKEQPAEVVSDSSETSESSNSVHAKEEKISEVKVSMDLLDEFMQMSGEMTVIRNMINKSVRSIEVQYQGDKDVAMLGELLEEMHKINSDVQNKITDIRRVPVKTLLKSITRSVRDACRALKKDIELVIEGDDLRLDNSITEVLSKSLIHLIRNSVDHGIEPKDDRLKANKSEKGILALRFKTVGESVVVEIEDDGAGINVEKIRQKVVEKGIRSEVEAKKLKVEELQQMIFDSGFSTAKEVTEFSGRGVGMSMVKDSIESMNGQIHIQSVQGKGTIFKIEIPIPKSVLITDCLFVQSGKNSFGIPQDNIIRILDQRKIDQKDIISLEGTEVLRLNSKLLPIFSLSNFLNFSSDQIKEEMLVVLNTGKVHFVMRVEKVLDVEDTVIKGLGPSLLKNLGIYLGGTFLGDGAVGLIFNVEGVAEKMGFHSAIEMKFEGENSTINNSSVEWQNVVIFELEAQGKFCISESDILRIENIQCESLSSAAGFHMMPYRESVLTMVSLSHLLENKDEGVIEDCQLADKVPTIIIKNEKSYLGIVVNRIIDLVKTDSKIIENAKKQIGITGCMIIDGQTISLINLSDLLSRLKSSANIVTAEEYAKLHEENAAA